MKLPLIFSAVIICLFTPQTFASPVDDMTKSFGCKDFRDDFFTSVHEQLSGSGQLPSPVEVERDFLNHLSSEKFQTLSESQKQSLAASFTHLTSVIDRLTTQDKSENTPRADLLAEIEMENHTTPLKASRADSAGEALAQFEQTVLNTLGDKLCAEPLQKPEAKAPEVLGTLFSLWQMMEPATVYGARKAFATAYQSCDVTRLPALSKATPDVAGIKVIGMYPDGIGKRRVVGDLQKLLKTDPYLSANHPGFNTCFDVEKSPLIYNYGGKPNSEAGTLNFFLHGGTGTTTLGVDCSGFVYTAMAAAGLKLKSSGHLKAYDVAAVPARAFQNPAANHLDCLNLATFTDQENLIAGDILASSGHVVIIDTVGDDPFGIAAITNEKDCVTAHINPARFDFAILQSSPTKGGIGIDRIRAADYLTEEPAMLKAMIQNAVSACLAKTRHQTVESHSSQASLIRHSTAASCQDAAIKLNHEECVALCPAVPGD